MILQKFVKNVVNLWTQTVYGMYQWVASQEVKKSEGEERRERGMGSLAWREVLDLSYDKGMQL